jgi:ribonuclease III
LKELLKKLLSTAKVQGNLDPRTEDFQKKIKYRFKNKNILKAALTHTSVTGNEASALSFERMEFFGDSILGFVISEYLFVTFPNIQEGELSKLKSQIVSRKFMAIKAKELGLGKYLYLSSEAASADSRNKKSILSNAMESLICAIYSDSGLKSTREFISKFILKDYKKHLETSEMKNFKSILQEYTQSKFQNVPIYKITNEEGPDHNKVFTLEVYINDELMGTGKGHNKKNAQQDAAKKACIELKISDE